MFTLNIYDKHGNYLYSICGDTRKACLDSAKKMYPEMAWDWDDKNFVKRKRVDLSKCDPSTTISLSLSDLI